MKPKEKYKSLSPIKKVLSIFIIFLTSICFIITLMVAIMVWVPVTSYKLTGKPEWVPYEIIIDDNYSNL